MLVTSSQICIADDADGMGKLKIIDTPMGNIARSLLKAGAKLGVSSRGSVVTLMNQVV